MDIPAEFGGPSNGRPIVDSDEYDRLDSAINQMLFPTKIEGGGVHRNLLPFYNALLVGSVRHVGKAATRIVPTACVFVPSDGQLNLAFNPYYIDELQKVLVRYPQDSREAEQLQHGTGPDRQVWLVRPSYSRLPSFVRASIFREALQRKLEAAGEALQPGWVQSVPAEIWATPPSELGIETGRQIAVRIDNRPLIGLLVHEILHVAHLHLLADRERYSDARILNLAMDTAIDQFIDDKYNNKWTFHRDLFAMAGEPALQPDMPFDHYYQRLEDFYKRNAGKTIQTPHGPAKIQLGPQSPGQGQPGQGQPGQGQGQPGQGQPGQGQGQPGGSGQGQPGQGQPGGGPPGAGSAAPGPGGIPMGPPDANGVHTIYVPMNVDEHDWKKPTKVDQFAQRAWLENFREKGREHDIGGKGLGSLLRSIEAFLRPSISWQPMLRRFIGDKIRVRREGTRKRPSRRLGWDSPGKKTIRSGRVIVAIDNSGSITMAECSQFFGEIGSFITVVDVVVVIWDTAIRQVVHVTLRSDLIRLAKGIGGGGGTDVFPVFAAIRDPSLVSDPKHRRLLVDPQGIIVLTDGDLVWPGPEYDVRPTLWGITKESNLSGPKFGIPLFVDLEKE